jgi:thiol-disulfide isomerase/thioredoxin
MRAGLVGLLCVLVSSSTLSCSHAQPFTVGGSPYLATLNSLESAGTSTGVASFEGRWVLVEFFATYCVPCLPMLQRLAELDQKYRARGLSTVAVGMDLEGRTMLEPFADYYRYPFPILIPSEAVRAGRSRFGAITELPVTVLLDREGKPAAAFSGVATEQQLRNLLEHATKADSPRQP